MDKKIPKGLNDLFKSSNNIDKINELTKNTREMGMRRKLSLELLIANPFQPRIVFDSISLRELSDSIKQHGLIQPITVRRSKNGENYEIIAGERRFRAAKMANLSEIDVIVQNWDDKTTRQMTLLENIQREDLNHIEIAKSYRDLQNEFSLTQSELSKVVSKNRSTVANFIRLLDLPTKTRLLVENGEITGSFARTLLSLKDNDLIDKWSHDKSKRKYSVNELEKIISNRNSDKNNKKNTKEKDIHLVEIENKFSEILETKVSIGPKNNKGNITINYSSPEQLVKLLKSISDYEL